MLELFWRETLGLGDHLFELGHGIREEFGAVGDAKVNLFLQGFTLETGAGGRDFCAKVQDEFLGDWRAVVLDGEGVVWTRA